MYRFFSQPKGIFVSLSFVLAVFFVAKIYTEYRHIGQLERTVQLEDSRVVDRLITSYLIAYQDIFSRPGIPLDDVTLEFLTPRAVPAISKKFAELTGEEITVDIVSDRPRNPVNLVDQQEKRAMEFFRRNRKATEFTESTNQDGKEYFFHASPLWMAASCLPCHTSREKAPAVIASRYSTGYGYREGDLRGLISIKVKRDRLQEQSLSLFFLKAAGSTLGLGLLFLGGAGALLWRIRRDEVNYTQELEQIVREKTASLQEKVKLLDEYKKVLDESAIVSKSDLEGNITYVNDRFCAMSGYSREELIGRPHSILRHPDVSSSLFADMWDTITSGRVWRGVFPSKCKNGDTRWNSSTICPIFDHSGTITEYIASRIDVTELIQKRQQLQKLLTTDTLTDLPNRFQLLQDEQKLASASLIMIDIYNFGEINDFYGIDIGDRVIRELAARVGDLCRSSAGMSLYRHHGDQLAILYRGDWDAERLEHFCWQLLEKVGGTPFVVDDNEIIVQVTCGISFRQENPLIEADLALKQAKRKGRFVQVVEESGDIRKILEKNHQWMHRLRDALEEDRIVPYYQPIIDSVTGKVSKYECLVRLIERDGTVVSPFAFLNVARKARIYPRITRAVIDHAVQAFSESSCDFSINLLSEDIVDLGLVDYMHEKLLKTPLADRVIFEVLETEGLENFDRILEFIKDVKRFGCRIAIDDFGTGYSNFERLLNLQVDFLKIDGSIIRMITEDEVSATIARTIVTVAGEIGVETVAEYVFDEKTAVMAREIGIDYLQGFYFSEPLPRDSLKMG